MYCSKCGNEILDEAVVCPKCGCLVEGKKAPALRNSGEISSAKRVAKIFMLIGCIATAFCLIPLLWTVPMYNSYCRKIETGEKVGAGFKLCCLLFVNTIAGIAMLCDQD